MSFNFWVECAILITLSISALYTACKNQWDWYGATPNVTLFARVYLGILPLLLHIPVFGYAVKQSNSGIAVTVYLLSGLIGLFALGFCTLSGTISGFLDWVSDWIEILFLDLRDFYISTRKK